jgi:hypothetical protein
MSHGTKDKQRLRMKIRLDPMIRLSLLAFLTPKIRLEKRLRVLIRLGLIRQSCKLSFMAPIVRLARQMSSSTATCSSLYWLHISVVIYG